MRPNPLFSCVIALGLIFVSQVSSADPSKYPQLAQQKLPQNVTPAFIFIDQLVAEVRAGAKPLIIDVRTGEEYHESHILGSVSVPIGDFRGYVENIPKDRLVVLY
ncbi:MAG: rhodanese-like domain-containing protein [Candidatus Binatia bacterium]